MNTRPLRVLVGGYAANPFQGSEPGVGWGWSVMAARLGHEVTVICGAQHRDDIETAAAAGDATIRSIQFVYVPRRRVAWLERVFPPAYLWTYGWWLEAAFREARRLHAERPFDVVHQCTYVGFRVPGHLWKLDAPFVWGPIGGLENTPWRFLPIFGASGCAYYAVRNIINSLQKRYLPGPKRAFQKAGASGGIIAATSGIQREIKKWYGQESQVICEIGPPSAVATEHSRREIGEPLRMAWSALHLENKALPLLLKSLATLPSDLDWELKILGQGPRTRQWKKLADKLGIAGRCRWLGWLHRDQALEEMRSAHVFVITSMKDLTSTVLVEALSQGLPVICPDHCGFSDVVTDQCGIKLPQHSPKQLEADLAAAIARLCDDEEERRRLAAGALRRVRDVSWEGKAEVLNAIYARAARS